MNETSEIVVAEQPFTVRRTARWSDCDPAGVVYAGQYPEYLLNAVSHFLRFLRGVPIRVAPELELPCKHLALTFHESIYPDNVVDIQVGIGDIRAHTFDVIARARFLDGRHAFDGVFAPICIKTGERFQKIDIPAELRDLLQRHRIDSENPA